MEPIQDFSIFNDFEPSQHNVKDFFKVLLTDEKAEAFFKVPLLWWGLFTTAIQFYNMKSLVVNIDEFAKRMAMKEETWNLKRMALTKEAEQGEDLHATLSENMSVMEKSPLFNREQFEKGQKAIQALMEPIAPFSIFNDSQLTTFFQVLSTHETAETFFTQAFALGGALGDSFKTLKKKTTRSQNAAKRGKRRQRKRCVLEIRKRVMVETSQGKRKKTS
eukprot:gene11146-20030_t